MKQVITQICKQTNLSQQEAWWMLEAITHKTKDQLLFQNKSNLTKQEQQTLDNWIEQLTQHNKPLAYLIGYVPFLNLTINIQPPILIPRPETEEWVQQLIVQLQPHHNEITHILDLGTGSGCIGLALAQALPKAHVIATDINQQALNLAQHNAMCNNIKNITFILSDLFKNINSSITFDLIVSNPPYINPKHKDSLSVQVLQWEDHAALFADQHGTHIIEQIMQQASNYLKKNIPLSHQLILEIDHDQKESVNNIAQQYGWTCHIQKDLFGKDRTAWCTTTQHTKK